MRITGFLLALSILGPTLGHAQASAPRQSHSYQPSLPAVVALHPADATPAPQPLRAGGVDRVAAHQFSSRAPGGAMIIMGSAALLAGLLTSGSGSTALIVGGIGVGAYGVYLYTR